MTSDGIRVFKTGMGWCGFASGERGVTCIILPVTEEGSARRILKEKYEDIGSCPHDVEQTIEEQLGRYFAGEKVQFSFPLDFSRCSPFARAVYKAVMTIPYGEVRSYGWVSREIGRPGASRAVGRVMGCNPFPPVMPCHRVVKGDGSMGGFSADMGIPQKIDMLEMEGVLIEEGRIMGSKVLNYKGK